MWITLYCTWDIQYDRLETKNNLTLCSFPLIKTGCLNDRQSNKKWKVHEPRNKNTWVLQFSDILLKSDKKQCTEMCVQYANIYVKRNYIYMSIYIHKTALESPRNWSILDSGAEDERTGRWGGGRLTFHSTPLFILFCFTCTCLPPSKTTLKRQMVSIPDFFINYICDLVQSLTSILSILKWGHTKF